MGAPADLCNRALAEIGTRSTITSLNEPSPEAINCKLVYEPMRRKLLRAAHWGFARTQVTLSTLGTAINGNAPFPYLYKYTYPPDCLRLRYIIFIPPNWPFPQGSTAFVQTGDDVVVPPMAPSRRNRFIISTDLVNGQRLKVILSNVAQAIGVYTCDIDDPDLWDSMFEDALVAAVASRIVIPLTGNIQMKSVFAQVAQGLIDEARAADGNEARPTTDHTPDWIRARGFQYDWYFSTMNQWGEWWGGWEDMNWGM